MSKTNCTNHKINTPTYSQLYHKRMSATVLPETMDPSDCGKTSSLPRAPTLCPPWVKICGTAVKTSATAIEYIPGKMDEVIPRESNVCVSSREAFFSLTFHVNSIIIRNQETCSVRSRPVYMQMRIL